MYPVYKVAPMPIGLVIVVPGINGVKDQFFDHVSRVWVEEYQDQTCLRKYSRFADKADDPDYKSQWAVLGDEIFRPGVVGRIYTVNLATGKRYEIQQIMNRAELVKSAGITI